MDDWFTVEPIDEATYAISEYRHWEETHCYLLVGTAKALLIDTGLGVSNIAEVVRGVTAKPVEVATTHVHWDHIGGHRWFETIAVFEAEKDWLSKAFPIPLELVKANLRSEPCEFPASFDITQYQLYLAEPSIILRDGDLIELGNRQIQVIHTPGHSPGHICFYESERKYLYTGDLIYAGCLDAFYPSTNPMHFMHSAESLLSLDVRKVLPGHHRLDIEVSLIQKICNGFHKISAEGKLHHGGGLFEFGQFQIHV